jgi:hypothetical protein
MNANSGAKTDVRLRFKSDMVANRWSEPGRPQPLCIANCNAHARFGFAGIGWDGTMTQASIHRLWWSKIRQCIHRMNVDDGDNLFFDKGLKLRITTHD